jgi:YtkA-like
MRGSTVAAAFVAMLVIAVPASAATSRQSPDIAASASGSGYLRTFTVSLTKHGAPVRHAQVVFSATMTQPMEMRIFPGPLPEVRPGVYRTRVNLLMFGDWKARFDVTGKGLVPSTRELNVPVGTFASPAPAKSSSSHSHTALWAIVAILVALLAVAGVPVIRQLRR